MRFPMINCLKYAQQCQNGIFKKKLGNNGTLFMYLDLPSILCKYWKYGESPVIPDAEKHVCGPFTR